MQEPLLVSQRNVAVQWHEAVALVSLVADALDDGRLRAVPGVHELALEADGSLDIGSCASCPNSRTISRSQPDRNLWQLLGDLLDTEAPAALRHLVEERANDVSAGDPAAVREALAFFERPDKRRDLMDLALRLGALDEGQRLARELRRLTDKARGGKAVVHREHRWDAARRRKWARRASGLLAATTIVVLALVVGSRVIQPRDRDPEQVSAVRDPAVHTGLFDRLRSAVRSAFSTDRPAPRPPAAAPVDAKQTGNPRRTASRPAGASSSTQPVTANDVASISPPPPLLPLSRVDVAPSKSEANTPPPVPGAVFDGRDPDVVPPTLLRPAVATVSPARTAGKAIGVVEALVREDGRVEEVRLLSTTAEGRYHDTMMLASVKAWVFQPATKHGQPVAYRLQITLR